MAADNKKGIPLEEYDIRKFIGVILRGRWFIILTPIAFFLPAAIYLRYTPYSYESVCTVKAENRQESNLGVANLGFAPKNEVALEIEGMEMLRSRPIVEKTIRLNDLEISYFKKGRFKDMPRTNSTQPRNRGCRPNKS